jgi:hypothetical protein
MKLKKAVIFLLSLTVVPISAQFGGGSKKTGDVLNGNWTGKQGDYYVEYWKDGGSGTMTLKDDAGFSCSWSCPSNNILFRKGIRPGTKDEVVTYSATGFNPNGVSYLSIYGWFKNPLVEYYIVENHGSYKPGGAQKGTVESDGSTYTIHESTRYNAASIEGTKTFQQYWSIRTSKRNSGTITCANHFKAWEKLGMTIGTFYEVSLNVEGYHNSGQADVTAAIGKDIVAISKDSQFSGSVPAILPLNRYTPSELYNVLGQKITGMSGRVNVTGQNSVMFNSPNHASGVYIFPVTTTGK